MDEIAQFDGNNKDNLSVFDDYMDHLNSNQKDHLRKQLEYFLQRCKEAKLFHDDLNPGNIMIDDNNNLVIIDF
jgi:predicted unusual protein kinase regulating ubiquinone biosynthesis (AarF/ABC1/UbiB family)